MLCTSETKTVQDNFVSVRKTLSTVTGTAPVQSDSLGAGQSLLLYHLIRVNWVRPLLFHYMVLQQGHDTQLYLLIFILFIPRWCILSIINNLTIIVVHTTYSILLFTVFTTTCFDPYMIIFRSCHLILGVLNHVSQLHILINLCMS